MNSKEEQTNSEVTNLENESFIEKQKDANYINEQTEKNKLDQRSVDFEDKYKFLKKQFLFKYFLTISSCNF